MEANEDTARPAMAGGAKAARDAVPPGAVAAACCPLLLVAGWLVLRLATAAWAALAATRTEPAFDDLVVGCALAVLGLTSAWLAVAIALSLLAEGVGALSAAADRAADVLAPRALRLLARAVCGAVVATPLGTVPAGAAELPVPDRPDTAAARVVAPALNRSSGPPSVVVRQGDSLWSIAAAQLPPGASAAGVAAAWPRLYAANRARIGDDPHLIQPGTRLRVPAELLDLSDRPFDDRPTPEEHR